MKKRENKMKKSLWILIVVIILLAGSLITYNYLDKDEKKVETKEKKTTGVTTTTKKEEKNIMDGITINYHASIRMEKEGKVIYFDPFKIDNTSNDADYIFITHSHYDH